MILKKLEIQGFKSFADRTEVVFTPGVIGVVGPNGSGKSNISDAILWVLGEQNVRALRGQKAQDVIFAGTDKRRPVGMAEVSLTVDNASGKLPLEYGEVTVTRRAYRSGESEFFINKTPCRLKDIYELFMDTGVGREAYSIISQGEMDAMLSARPEDRRTLFDEAAGIKKYRHRKKEAERKLENVEGNLFRVNDIIHEIEGEVEPMREQAEVAKRYIELTGRLREIEVGILVNDLQRFTRDLEQLRESKDVDGKTVEDLEYELLELEEKESELSAKLANADGEVEAFASVYQEALTHQERTESQLALLEQRHESAEKSEVSLSAEIVQIEERAKGLEAERAGLSTEDVETGREEAEIGRRIGEMKAKRDAIQAKITAAGRTANQQKSSYIELAKQLAAQKNELGNAAGRIEGLRALLTKRAEELAAAKRASDKAVAERAEAETAVAGVKEELANVTASTAGLREQVAGKKAEAAKATEELAHLHRAAVDKGSRLKTLREMEDAKEGYYFGVRSVNAAVKSGSLSGNFAVVADVIKVPRGYETAYEVALGGSLQDIVTDTERDAKAAIEHLKRTKGGRATFLPLNMMRHNSSPGLSDLVGKNGILGIASDLLDFDKKYAPAICSLLGRVLVAKDIDSAIAVSKKAMGWSKIVTIDGELVFPSGAMTGGHAPGKTVNILGRKQEIDALESDVRDLRKRAEALDARGRELAKAAEDLADELRTTEERATALKMSVLEKERHLDFVGREVKRLMSEADSLAVEKKNIEADLTKAEERRVGLENAVASADAENTSLDDTMARTEEEAKALDAELEAVNTEINALSVSVASLSQKRLGAERTIANLESTRAQLAAELSRKKEQLAAAITEKGRTAEEITRLRTALDSAKKTCETTKVNLDEWRRTKQALATETGAVTERVKELSRNRDELNQKLHSAELKEARLDMQITQSAERLLAEYEVTTEDALASDPPEVKHGSATEVMRLRKEIRSMGEVNTGAVQEYSRLTERYEFLSTQREDLLEAKGKLVSAIKEIDESTQGVFMETFNAVQEHFSAMFLRLFGGGKTELVLTMPDDVLETGIDVMVEMPGKKRQNLHLLSGGERALTAAALMFALMSVRPSPFCLLDEVDAPLDEANVERFAEMIRDFGDRQQMIVITHNKSTMERADMLYGVTMQEPGISTLVSVKLSDMPERN